MYCGAYAMVFNDSSDPNPPATNMSPEDCLESAIAQYSIDADFVQSIFVETPVIADVPTECKAEEVEYFTQLESIYETLDDLANVADYMLNPKYPMTANTEGYYCCSNSLFSALC